MLNEPFKSNGFTLVEMMIVVAIAAILFAIALPAYQDQVRRTKRSDGKGYLMEIAAAQERFFSQNVSYATKITTGAVGETSLGFSSTTSPEGYYTVSLAGTATTFTLTATPTFTDTECTTLSLTHTNAQSATGTTAADCWD